MCICYYYCCYGMGWDVQGVGWDWMCAGCAHPGCSRAVPCRSPPRSPVPPRAPPASPPYPPHSPPRYLPGCSQHPHGSGAGDQQRLPLAVQDAAGTGTEAGGGGSGTPPGAPGAPPPPARCGQGDPAPPAAPGRRRASAPPRARLDGGAGGAVGRAEAELLAARGAPSRPHFPILAHRTRGVLAQECLRKL